MPEKKSIIEVLLANFDRLKQSLEWAERNASSDSRDEFKRLRQKVSALAEDLHDNTVDGDALGELVSLADVAAAAGLNRSHAWRKFRNRSVLPIAHGGQSQLYDPLSVLPPNERREGD